MEEPIISATGIHKTYDTGTVRVDALRGVDLHVRRGEMVAIMGPSGCGKTTLLNCLSGLDDIDSGRVLIDGMELHKLADDERSDYRARKMGFVFQLYNLLPVLSAVENVELPLLVSGVGAGEARRRSMEMLDLVGLADRAHHTPGELSGGERQRASLGLALLRSPDCLLMDEPFAGVAPIDVQLVTQALLMLRAQGTALVISGQDVNEIFSVSDEIIWVVAGTTHWLGSPDQARRHHQFSREYLGPACD